jgi:hypothetical protein
MIQNKDYTFKILLLLLVIGVWGLLASPFIGTYASQNKGGADKPAPATAPRTQRQYSAWVNNYGKLEIGDTGIPAVRADELASVLEATPRLGWKVHSVAYTPGIGTGYYIVIVEK